MGRGSVQQLLPGRRTGRAGGDHPRHRQPRPRLHDVIEKGGAHPHKAGPCARFDGLEQFSRLRVHLDGCLTGSQLAKDRAAEALTKVMIPEALDYPA